MKQNISYAPEAEFNALIKLLLKTVNVYNSTEQKHSHAAQEIVVTNLQDAIHRREKVVYTALVGIVVKLVGIGLVLLVQKDKTNALV